MEETFLPGLIIENQNKINNNLNRNLNLLSSLNFHHQNNNVNLFSNNNLFFNKEEEYNNNNSSKNSTSEFFFKNKEKNVYMGYNKENEGKMNNYNNFLYQPFSFNNNINNNFYNNQINYVLNFPLIFQPNNILNSLYNPFLFYQNNLKNLYNFCNFVKPMAQKQEFIQPNSEEKKVLLNSDKIRKINNNLFLNKKRKRNKIKFSTRKIIINKNKIIPKENKIDNSIQKKYLVSHDKNKNDTFVIYKKSKYVFKKRKPKVEKIVDKSLLKCEHCNIEIKTKKMKTFHHLKKSKECFDDTIHLLKMIFELKKIILKNVNNLNSDYMKNITTLYKDSLKNISLCEYLDISSEFSNDN